jgi:endonuclease/exonuclease/phosphatase family metal-dependent hydrolase
MEVGLTVANIHLAPGKGNTELRMSQLAAVIDSSPTERIVVIGDTNTRASEITKIKDSGLEVPDLPGPTWDSFRNRFNADSPRFKASFTRCIIHPDVKIRDLKILEGKVIRNEKSFHISDHFALFGRMQL